MNVKHCDSHIRKIYIYRKYYFQVVNFGADEVKLNISVAGLDGSINSSGSTKTILTSDNLMDENSFDNPNKVIHLTI